MTDFHTSPTTSELFEEDSTSIRDKSLIKRSISKHHNNNFKAGYVPVNEQYLNKTGLRGRKTFAFWVLVILLSILAVGNLILTITILGVLKLGQGMESIELIPDENAIKFFGNTDLGHVYKRDGKIEGFLDEPVEISAEESTLYINLLSPNGRSINKVKINENGTLFRGFQIFEVKNKKGDSIFSSSNPEFRQMKINSMNTRMVRTNRIVSPIRRELKISGDHRIYLKGGESTKIDSKDIEWSADGEIYLNTPNGSIIFSHRNGTFINIRRLPVAELKPKGYLNSQFKVCVCMPEGKLFKIPVTSGASCHKISMSPQHNPCV